MLRVLVEALSARAILFLALLGAFVLAWKAMSDQTYMTLGILAIYCVCAIFPVAFLEFRRRT